MSRVRLLSALGLGVALGAAGGFLAFQRGWDVLGARNRRAPAATEGAGAPRASETQAPAPADASWRPAPIGFRAVASLGGLPAAVFGGAPAWGDLEGDGDPDLLVAGGAEQGCGLFLNVGGGVLVATAERLQLPEGAHFGCGAFADLDADGDLDLFLAGTGGTSDQLLVQREDGRFEPATEEYGLAIAPAGLTRAATWCDLDGDGRLDLFLQRAGAPDVLARREAGATFVEIPGSAGFDAAFDPRSVLVGDLDGDLDLDLYVCAGDAAAGADRMYANRGDGSFVDASELLGGELRASSSCAALGDLDGDGLDDLLLAGAKSGLSLLRARGDAHGAFVFEDASAAASLPGESAAYRQLALADLDLDGALDALALGARGLELFRNRGDGSFTDETHTAGFGAATSSDSVAFALADFDLDGDLDLVLTGAGAPTWLENRARGAGWLRIEARGLAGNPRGAGAVVRVLAAGGRRLARAIGTGPDERSLSIGLGGAESALEVRIDWSDGGQTRVQGVPAGVRLVVEQTRAPRLVGSHPAALAGELASFALEPALERVSARLGGALPAPDEVEIQQRVQAVRAWAGASGASLEEPPWLAAARARIEGEVRLEFAARAAVQRVRIAPEELQARIAVRRALWDVPARVSGTLFVFHDASAAEQARARAALGESSAALIAAFGLSERELALAEGPGHQRAFALDAAHWARLDTAERAPFATGALPEPGAVSPVHARGDGFAFMLVEQVLPPAPVSRRVARERAMAELRRERAGTLVDELLGLPPNPLGRPSPRD